MVLDEKIINAIKGYENKVDELVDIFIEKHDYPDNSYWVNDEVGGIIDAGGVYFFSFNDILLDLKRGVPKNVIEEWQDYCLSVASMNQIIGNFISDMTYEEWLDGSKPKYTEEDFKKMKNSYSLFVNEMEKFRNKGNSN